ncbi:MAG: SDR family oxidoreductase [Cytophagales bacterium]|jgi:3-oxoacyl-[acyl-carrier protein] reductase|nr:SDR family oxidoreductase [Cytophagales bacterium]
MNSLKNKVVIITGCATGIGGAVVRGFSEKGAIVVSTFHKRKNENDKSFLALQVDVRDYRACENFVNNVLEKFGRVDVVVNVAGIEKGNLLIKNIEEDWNLIMDTNLKSIFNITKFAINGMLENGGAIINVGSIIGIFGCKGESIYAASKAGIIGFSKSIAKEYAAKNIRCNVVAPGLIVTDLVKNLIASRGEEVLNKIPLKRFGTPEEVANLILFLSSEKSSFITGQTIQIDGGMII